MTSHELKCIFIHFPRTAGSSIEKFLLKTDDIYGNRENTYCDKDGNKRTIKEEHHTSSDKYIKQNGKEIWDEYFTFSFMRNPWDWFVSNFYWDIYQYEQCIKNNRPIKYRRKFIVEESNSDFKTYVKKGAQRPDWFVFTQAKDFIGNVDFVGRFENIKEDMEKICNNLGIEYQNLSHENKMNRKEYTEYYDDEAKDIVYNLFKIDIDYFNYNFGD